MAGVAGSEKAPAADGPKGPEPVKVGEKEYPPLADGQYDYIVCGTGLKECILSGLLTHDKQKVLVVDRNDFYGGETSSLSASLYRKFIKDEEPTKEYVAAMGRDNSFCVDLIPKFVMANGKLVKLLRKTNTQAYIDFYKVHGSFVFTQTKGKGIFTSGAPGIDKVPATEGEAISTGLVGTFEKNALRNFLVYCSQCDVAAGKDGKGRSIADMTMGALYKEYGLSEDTQDFVGHAMALRTEDSYKEKPAVETIREIRLYAESLRAFGGSPFLYPEYGLSALPESFSRYAALAGGVFMLRCKYKEVLLDAEGKAVGIVDEDGCAATAKAVIGDPTYFPKDKRKANGEIIRTICILAHKPTCLGDFDKTDSAQIILPQKQLGRSNDVYVSILSSQHKVVPKGKYLAIVSTRCETREPEKEVEPALQLLGKMVCKFQHRSPYYEPASDGSADACFLTASYDATSHFESTMADALDVYRRVTGKEFNLEIEEAAAGGGGGKSS